MNNTKFSQTELDVITFWKYVLKLRDDGYDTTRVYITDYYPSKRSKIAWRRAFNSLDKKRFDIEDARNF